ncbi:hypothetical protein BGZ72_001429 [Mortierella alpina]|nr:hypothetical protein BGZ72_001429 [Mortierella alpina]
MSSKRSFQQREEEPWLRYPDIQNTPRDYSRSAATSFSPVLPHKGTQASPSFGHQREDSFQFQSIMPMPQQHTHRTEVASSSKSSVNHKRSISKVNASTLPSYSPAYNEGDKDSSGFQHRQRWSFSPRVAQPQPRTLSEELSMALQNPQNNYPSPTTPSGLDASPTDMSIASSSSSSATAATATSSTQFPLFTPSAPSQQSSNGSAGQKAKPSPLSLNYSAHNSFGASNTTGVSSPSFPFRTESPTSAISHNSTHATDIAGSPRAASAAVAATFSTAPMMSRPQHHHGYGRGSISMSSAASTSGSSYYSSASSPRALSPPCSALCHHRGSFGYQQHRPGCPQHQHQHHPACQHHTGQTLQQNISLEHHPKPGRATKGIQRFGFPQFRPEMDDSHPGSSTASLATMRTASTSTSGSVYGMQRERDDDDDMDDVGTSMAVSEPPKKRLRSTASMLLDAAVETVIFTGAVALSAYQLLTGKGLGSGNHSKQSSFASDDTQSSREDTPKTQDEDPMEEKLALQLDIASASAPRALRNYSSANTLGRPPRPGSYYRAKTPRPYRSRQSFSSSGHHHLPLNQTGHARSSSMPVRPNTGTEDTDEAFLRMEAQLNNLIAEGKRALNSRIEVWDEE